jgi:hypothetical protein
MANLGAIGVMGGDGDPATPPSLHAGTALSFTSSMSGDSRTVSTRPYVTNYLPLVGSSIKPGTAIQFDVLDLRGLASVSILNQTPAGTETVYTGTFGTNYAISSTATTIQNGIRFVLVRTGGWTSSPQLVISATNIDGGQL